MDYVDISESFSTGGVKQGSGENEPFPSIALKVNI